jgi:hypothetical protein
MCRYFRKLRMPRKRQNSARPSRYGSLQKYQMQHKQKLLMVLIPEH